MNCLYAMLEGEEDAAELDFLDVAEPSSSVFSELFNEQEKMKVNFLVLILFLVMKYCNFCMCCITWKCCFFNVFSCIILIFSRIFYPLDDTSDLRKCEKPALCHCILGNQCMFSHS